MQIVQARTHTHAHTHFNGVCVCVRMCGLSTHNTQHKLTWPLTPAMTLPASLRTTSVCVCVCVCSCLKSLMRKCKNSKTLAPFENSPFVKEGPLYPMVKEVWQEALKHISFVCRAFEQNLSWPVLLGHSFRKETSQSRKTIRTELFY